MIRRDLIIIFLLLFNHLIISGQELIQYNLADGLTSIEVSDIAENENFLWIATSDGLNRFDGKSFKIYKSDKNKVNSISGNNIETLFFDSNGMLWIGLKNGGVDIYDPRKDFFYHINDIIDIPSPGRVISVYEDSQKNIWLGTWEEGLYQLFPKPGDSLAFKAKIHYPGYIVSTLLEKPKGILRVGTYYGLLIYDIAKNTWFDNGNHDKAITQLLPGQEKNSIWASTWSSGLLKINWDEDHPEIPVLDKIDLGAGMSDIYRILSLNNKLFLGTWGNGLIELSTTGKYKVNKMQAGNFNPSFINCLFQDRYQNVWIGTFGEGLYRLIPGDNGIYHFPTASNLPKPAVSLASVGENKIFVGTQGAGIYLVDLANESMEKEFQGIFTGNFKSYILTLYPYGNQLFIGHDGSGIQLGTKISPNQYKLKDFNFSPQIEKGNVFYIDNDSVIWLGTKQNGFVSFTINPKTHKQENYHYYRDVGRESITGIVPYKENRLFISTQAGLYIFNTDSGKIENNGVIINNESVYKILGDIKNKYLWIGTSTNLLCAKYDKPDSICAPLDNGILPQGSIRSMIHDSQNNLWFSVGERLFCKLNDNNRLRAINPELTGKHTILSSTTMDNNGTENLVFGTSDNLLILDPEYLLKQPEVSKILLTKLEIDHKNIGTGDKLYGNVILNDALEYSSSLKLSHKCKWISLSFIESGWDIFNTSYQFRIKNFSDKWQYIDLNNPVTFSQLMPGKYVLEIRRFESAGYSPVNWSLELEVLPPWWGKRIFRFIWALSILSMTIATAFILNIKLKRRHLQKVKIIEKEKKEELLREKESFFSGLSHDLMTTFSLILAPVNDLIRENKQNELGKEKLEIIKKNTSFLSDMFGTIFDFKRAEFTDKKIHENSVELVSFTRLIAGAFEYLATSRNIKLEFTTNIEALHVTIDNIKVERILYNLLSNAIKFTPDNGQVSLKMDFIPPEHVNFKISDNGIGMDLNSQQLIFEKFYRDTSALNGQEAKGLGLGLYIVKKFVTIIGGTINVDSELNHGTTVQVEIPVKTDLNKADNEVMKITKSFSDEKSTILVVEDNLQLLNYTTEKLRSFFNVIPVSTAEQALQAINNYLPEIVITDIMMPGTDGLSLTRTIKADARLSDIFVVILTAKSSTEDELNGYKQGADIYLKKPIDLEVLLKQMINIHNTRQNRKSQIYTDLISKDDNQIEFDSRETFLKWSMQIIEDQLMNADFTMDDFATEMNISKSVLHRKFKLLVGQTPNQFIKIIRLRKSVELLKKSDLSISEIAYMTGFNQSHYFIKCFKEVYNQTPKNYRKNVLNIT